ncbi:M35 family metallo-endopeptidase [Massilia genomosp. 1]|nr:M35 family metallo-endopeptidase [Massilia genomosp. 1]
MQGWTRNGDQSSVMLKISANHLYVCGAFWRAPVTGTDSQGGTLVHEMSHFTAVAGTREPLAKLAERMKIAWQRKRKGGSGRPFLA